MAGNCESVTRQLIIVTKAKDYDRDQVSTSPMSSNRRKLVTLLKLVCSGRRRPSNVPPLPYEIHYRILQFLSFNELFRARGVNHWYYDTCLKIIHDKYIKPSRLLLREWNCETWLRHSLAPVHCLEPVSERGSNLLKWEGKELPFNKFPCGWNVNIVLIGGECRRVFVKFSYCVHNHQRQPAKWLMKRMQVRDKSGLRDMFVYAHTDENYRNKKKLIKDVIGDGVNVMGLNGLPSESAWEMIIPVAMLPAMVQDYSWYYI
jgi:hypothetical protein